MLGDNMGSGSSLEDSAVGYNDEDCLEIARGIDRVYTAAIGNIKTYIECVIVFNVSKSWYSEVAVDYFTKFKENCSKASDDIRIVFQNFRDQIQSNIDDWRQKTKMCFFRQSL